MCLREVTQVGTEGGNIRNPRPVAANLAANTRPLLLQAHQGEVELQRTGSPVRLSAKTPHPFLLYCVTLLQTVSLGNTCRHLISVLVNLTRFFVLAKLYSQESGKLPAGAVRHADLTQAPIQTVPFRSEERGGKEC